MECKEGIVVTSKAFWAEYYERNKSWYLNILLYFHFLKYFEEMEIKWKNILSSSQKESFLFSEKHRIALTHKFLKIAEGLCDNY